MIVKRDRRDDVVILELDLLREKSLIDKIVRNGIAEEINERIKAGNWKVEDLIAAGGDIVSAYKYALRMCGRASLSEDIIK